MRYRLQLTPNRLTHSSHDNERMVTKCSHRGVYQTSALVGSASIQTHTCRHDGHPTDIEQWIAQRPESALLVTAAASPPTVQVHRSRVGRDVFIECCLSPVTWSLAWTTEQEKTLKCKDRRRDQASAMAEPSKIAHCDAWSQLSSIRPATGYELSTTTRHPEIDQSSDRTPHLAESCEFRTLCCFPQSQRDHNRIEKIFHDHEVVAIHLKCSTLRITKSRWRTKLETRLCASHTRSAQYFPHSRPNIIPRPVLNMIFQPLRKLLWSIS